MDMRKVQKTASVCTTVDAITPTRGASLLGLIQFVSVSK